MPELTLKLTKKELTFLEDAAKEWGWPVEKLVRYRLHLKVFKSSNEYAGASLKRMIRMEYMREK